MGGGLLYISMMIVILKGVKILFFYYTKHKYTHSTMIDANDLEILSNQRRLHTTTTDFL